MSPTSRKKKVKKMLSDERKKAIVAKLLGNNSCRECQYLYANDYGYSNYTVTDTYVHCALDRNPNLKGVEVNMPYDFIDDARRGINDRWPPTRDSACEHFCPRNDLSMAQFDVEGDITIEDATAGFSPLAVAAITKHRSGGDII